ncbi:MAG: nickel-dependent hydrogenase large subunit [Chloroflexi bacterium]|nr:nickel-dependent hydrogenase large subunit [Chloroflexota bacterium]
MTRVVLDPVTRVGGQLRVEAEISDGTVTDAWVSGTSYRGLERILEGRDARDAWLMAQRICGSCGWAHALASVGAVEQALGVTPPTNARLIRNLLAGTQLVVDEVSGFYLRQALDWIDLRAALTADPDATSTLARAVSPWPNSGSTYFATIQGRLAAMIGSSQPGPFAIPPVTHPGYHLSPETSLMVAAHYFEALDWRREVLHLETVLGGRSPHLQTLVVGGLAIAPDWGGPARPVPGEHIWDVVRTFVSPLGAAGLAAIGTAIDSARAFVEQVFVPDVMTTMKAYRDWGGKGRGIGHYLAFGALSADGSEASLALPRGRVMDRDLTHLIQVAESGIGETTAHAWYAPGSAGNDLQHPSDGGTEPLYTGPKLPYASLADADRYSWIKAPRYEDDPMEVGPLARMLVASAAGVTAAREAVGRALTTLNVGQDELFGTFGRMTMRAVEAGLVAKRLTGWLSDLRDSIAAGDLAMADLSAWDPASWPRDAEGFALGESARGAVGHWVRIHDGRIAGYQIVDASTWNASPRDQMGRRGALEAALVGTSVVDPGRPLELLRTVHSFDPCPSCGAH